jgi:hypothetical protein
MNTQQRIEAKAKSNRERALDAFMAALTSFMARKFEIDAMLQRLTELSANHFGGDPEDVDWGHVGTLGHYHQLLCQVCDSAFREGDYAA